MKGKADGTSDDSLIGIGTGGSWFDPPILLPVGSGERQIMKRGISAKQIVKSNPSKATSILDCLVNINTIRRPDKTRTLLRHRRICRWKQRIHSAEYVE